MNEKDMAPIKVSILWSMITLLNVMAEKRTNKAKKKASKILEKITNEEFDEESDR